MVTPVVEQGDLLRVGGIKWPVIVVSNNFFNASGRVIACPILPDAVEGPLHIRLKDCPVEGYVGQGDGSLVPLLNPNYHPKKRAKGGLVPKPPDKHGPCRSGDDQSPRPS